MREIALEGGAVIRLYDQAEKAKCKACGKEITFGITGRGHRMPVEQDEQGKWVSHFATCPEAKRFRKKKGGQGGRMPLAG